MSDAEPKKNDPRPEQDGDLSLIRWMLSLQPAERLAVLQGHVAAALQLRGKGREWTSDGSSTS